MGKWIKQLKICVWMLLLGSLACGCGGCGSEKALGDGNTQTKGYQTDGGENPSDKLKVVTTLFPYYDFTRQIAGDAVELTMVVPAGMDSHSFEPTPADMRTIQEADLLICNGGAMEHWLSQVLEAVDASGVTVVTMMDYVDAVQEEIVEGMEDEVHDHDHTHAHEEADVAEHHHVHDENCDEDHDHAGSQLQNWTDDDGHHTEIEYDEHIWTSPVNAMAFTNVIADTLMEMDPENRERYDQAREEYLKELEAVHEGFLDVAAHRQRNMIIVGDKFPFRYLADEYGFFYRAAFSGCSTDTEPSARTIAYLIDKVREEQMPVVYYLELSSHRVTEIIGEETGAQPELLHSCHNVTRKEFDSGITYVELMQQNIENLRKGLVE